MPSSKRDQPATPRTSGAKRSRKGLHAHVSSEEVRFVASVLVMMHGNADALAQTIEAGKTFLNSDAAIVISETCVLVLEWDGEAWHTAEERKANDVLKTKQIIADFPQAMVVRMRSKCGPLPVLDNEPRAMIIETKRNTAEAAQQLPLRVFGVVPDVPSTHTPRGNRRTNPYGRQ